MFISGVVRKDADGGVTIVANVHVLGRKHLRPTLGGSDSASTRTSWRSSTQQDVKLFSFDTW
jgi:hypothetical protein